MAKFINQRDDDELNDDETVDSLEENEESEEVQEAQEEPSEDDGIPEKYRNKDIKDIVRMHQEAEKLLGRQSQEVGELRKTFDEYIKTQLEKENQAHNSTEVDEIDFYADPQRAVEYAIANHPKVKEAESVSAQLKQQEAISKLKNAHPDFPEIAQNQDFVNWVTQSKFRIEMLRKADREYDFEAADELLTLWKERQNLVKETVKSESKARKDSVKKASTGSTQGSAEAPSRKVYRRADIIKLIQTDPDRYQQLAAEIRQAYAEGRVR